jgi:hypothetical protein
MSDRASGHDGDRTRQVDRLGQYLSHNQVIAGILQEAPSLAMANWYLARDASLRRSGISSMVSRPPSASRITIWSITTPATSRSKPKQATRGLPMNSSPTCTRP